MPRGGARPNAGRKPKMKPEELNQLFAQLFVERLNHRYGEQAIDLLPIFYISINDKFSVSLSKLQPKYGIAAVELVKKFFNVEEGEPGKLSLLTLKTDAHPEMLEFLSQQGVSHLLRRDKQDGLFDSWVEMTEFTIQQRISGLAAVATKNEKSEAEYNAYVARFGKLAGLE